MTEMNPPQESPNSASIGYALFISAVAAMGGLLFGYDWVVISGAKPFLYPTFTSPIPTPSDGRCHAP